MGGNARYKTPGRPDRRAVGRDQRRNGINSKTDPYKADRHRIKRILGRNRQDDGTPIPNAMSRVDELNHMYGYNTMMKTEPEITADVKRVSEAINANLLGIEKRRKSLASATRKANNNKLNPSNPQEINDLVRFTHEVSEQTFGKDVNKALNAYKNAGYKVETVKNFWTKPWEYKRINVTLRDRNGKPFEVQFHTRNSFEIKDGPMHKLYEQQRKYKEGTKAYNEIGKKMEALAKEIRTPHGVYEIENLNWF